MVLSLLGILRGLKWGFKVLCSLLGFVGFCGAKVFVGFREASRAFVGLWGVLWVFERFRGLLWVLGGVSWVSWAFVGFCFYTRFREKFGFEVFFSTWRLVKTGVISSIFQSQFLP